MTSTTTSEPAWLAALGLSPGEHSVFPAPTNSDYTSLGLVVTPVIGKTPVTKKWQLRENCFDASNPPPDNVGVGLCHAFSHTMAVDVDRWDRAEAELALAGINLQALYDADDAVTIESGRAGHGKLLYRMPPNLVLNSKKLIDKGPDGKAFNYIDFRCSTSNGGTVQDVLPGAAIHPDTGKPYRFGGKGHYTRLPTIPAPLLAFWFKLLKKDSERKIDSGTEISASWDEIRSALGHISPDCSRPEWIAVGMALHWAGEQTDQLDEAFTLWDEFSQPSSKYQHQIMEQQWLSFRSDKDSLVKLGTLYRMAREGGWIRPVPDASELFSALPDAGAAAPAAMPAGPAQVGFADVSISDVLTDPEPPHKFVVGGIVPAGALTLFSGHGGSGKSTMAIELAMHVAIGRPYLGMAVEQTNVLIMSAEDGAGVLRQRIGKLCRRHGIEPSELAKRLTVLDATSDPILWASNGRNSAGPTDAYNRLAQRCNTDKIGLMVVDNSSDAFSGDAFDKSGVTQFVRHLTRCVSANNGAVVLLAHVNRTTASGSINSTGSWADSVAWHNAARSRLYLDNSSDRLQLVHEKSNFGPLAKTLQLTRHPDGGFTTQNGNINDSAGLLVDVLRFVQTLTSEGGWVGTSMHGTTANNIARKQYRDHPNYPAALRGGARNQDAHRTIRDLLQMGFLISEKRWHGAADAKYKRNNDKPNGLWLTDAGLNFLETGELPTYPDRPEIEFPDLRLGDI